MKKLLSVLSVSLLATVAHAEELEVADVTEGFESSGLATSTLTVRGQVTQSTCQIEVGSHAKAVELPSVATNQLKQTNATAGNTPFTITLVDCPANYAVEGEQKHSVALKFMESNNVNASTGNLNNTDQAGTNVQVQLLNHENKVINLANNENNTQAHRLSENGAYPQFLFSAQYFASEPATAGAFSSSVPFEIVYK